MEPFNYWSTCRDFCTLVYLHTLSSSYLLGVGIGVPPTAVAAIQPAQQAPVAQTAAAQAANMQPQNTPQHQQLLMKQQQVSAFLSPQSNPQVGILPKQD